MSKEWSYRNLLIAVIEWTWVGLTFLAAFSMLNYPRTWWQELLASTSPIWGSFFLIIFLLHVGSVYRGRRKLPLLISCGLEFTCLLALLSVVVPYVWAPQKISATRELIGPVRVLLLNAKTLLTGDARALARQIIAREQPDILAFTGERAEDQPLSELAQTFPFELTTNRDVSLRVEPRFAVVLSKFPFGDDSRRDVGFGALPALYGSVQLSTDTTLDIGVVDLLPSFSSDDFSRSRLTSRRIASIARYSEEPRVILGAFRASMASHIVNMYVGPLRLRSVHFDGRWEGLERVFTSSLDYTSNIHAFTSRSILVTRVTDIEETAFSGIVLDLAIPRGAPSKRVL